MLTMYLNVYQLLKLNPQKKKTIEIKPPKMNMYRQYFYFSLIYYLVIILWGSKIWAHDLGPGTTFYQQYAREEEITEDRCN